MTSFATQQADDLIQRVQKLELAIAATTDKQRQRSLRKELGTLRRLPRGVTSAAASAPAPAPAAMEIECL